MTIFLKLYGIAFLVFFVVDLIWLGLVAKRLYQKEIGQLVNYPPLNRSGGFLSKPA
jgi:uncharacterized membrane protein